VNRSNHVMSALVLGIGGLAAPASADVFVPHFPVTELHSVQGAFSAGSFAAAGMMGAQGFSNASLPPSWELSMISSCTAQTQALGVSIWPQGCNPTGMAVALRQVTSTSWVAAAWADTDQASALNEMVTSLQAFGSPVVVPIFGQADHWVTVTQITATSSGGSWLVNLVKYLDGGPPGGFDSNFNNYDAGVHAFSGNTWRNFFFKVATNINPSCDPTCTSDPFYSRYVLVFDPPRGQAHPAIPAVFANAPGVVQGGMTEALAQTELWNALAAGGIAADREIGSAIRGGVAGPAFQVNAVLPSGAAWNYYLVPIVSPANTVLALVQLAAADGAFEGIHVLSTPAQLTPVTRKQAEVLAARALAPGERLTGGALTWNPRTKTQLGTSPTSPYYEFDAIDTASQRAGLVRVALHRGTVERVP